MGNYLLREYRKRVHVFKARQHSQKENEVMSSAPIQEGNAEQTSSEELCYTFINHRVLARRPSGSYAEGYYENVPCHHKRLKESLQGTETEYSLVRVPPTPRAPPSQEDAYELLMPGRTASRSLQQPCLFTPSTETLRTHL
ncbi:germinal center-associated signaling and motility protein isoform X2 [Tamandua tetradactyla]|uniref:germinal center-associated signaling and motility protein isoform X2 n=1 Tax=Tamandua tetradactyla TaxID=48850 RepID=UPI0040549F0C